MQGTGHHRRRDRKTHSQGYSAGTHGETPQTPRAKAVIKYSLEEAGILHHKYVGTEHILLGLLREEEGVAAQVLMNLGLPLEKVRAAVRAFLGVGADVGTILAVP